MHINFQAVLHDDKSYARCLFFALKAFIKTAENIYGKIKEGVYDPSREGNGVKLGSMASTASKATAGKAGGCC